MEFSNRSAQQPIAPAPARAGKKPRGKLLSVVSVVLLVGIALLIGAIIWIIANGNGKTEKEYVDKGKYQAVFLNGGQVYFGKVKDLNSRFVILDSIYYLRVNQQQAEGQDQQQAQANQDVSLAKLGCELHGPQDQMVINREQVTFWENLKDDGQVAKAIAEFVKQNPDGQKCTEPNAQQ